MSHFIAGRVIVPTPQEGDAELDNLRAGLAVHCGRGLLEVISDHARAHRDREVFGLLLGRAVRTPSGKLRTVLEQVMLAESLSISTSVAVEVSAAELIRLNEVFEENHKRAGLLRV